MSCMTSRGHNTVAIIPTSNAVNIGHWVNAAVPILERLDKIEITDPSISRVARVERAARIDDSMLVIPPGNLIDSRAAQHTPPRPVRMLSCSNWGKPLPRLVVSLRFFGRHD